LEPSQQSWHVLVIEDDPDIRAALAEALASEGYAVEVARDGVDGLAQARSVRPDLIVLDLTMPVMDGLEFLEAKRAVEDLAGVPVIVETARSPAPVLQDCAVVLCKPFELDALFEAARRCLAGPRVGGA
jgi:two-component system response regulator MprA